MPNQVLVDLGNMSNVVLAVACVAALWLLARELGLNVSRSGFNASPTYGIGSYTALTGGGIVEVGYAQPQQPELVLGVQSGFSGSRAGMNGQEPPVFWNPGSYIDVNNLQSSGIQGETVDPLDAVNAANVMAAQKIVDAQGNVGQSGFLGQRFPSPYVARSTDGFANKLNMLTSPY